MKGQYETKCNASTRFRLTKPAAFGRVIPHPACLPKAIRSGTDKTCVSDQTEQAAAELVAE
ncbi:MAG: hypothetical protein Q8N51_05875, partial [Gammaproteobacteria bacterium]|nr:hypothetical protein [Gammaproteobacteria bacterium]